MKNILLATELVPEKKRAFERAVKLATTLSAKLHILHICPLYSVSKKNKQTISLKRDAEDLIKTSLAAYKGVKKLNTSITVIEGGEIFAEIINHAEKVKAGLIVMGMHGKGKFPDMFVGTTIERVIRKGIRPVLMVRNKPQNEYKNILVGIDFSDGAKQAFHVALELAPKSNFHLVHSHGFKQVYLGGAMANTAEVAIADLEDNKLDRFTEQNKKVLKKYKVAPKNLHFSKVSGEAHSCLMREATKVKSDLIAIGTHSRSSFIPYTLGGTAKDILSSPPCDVLIAKGL